MAQVQQSRGKYSIIITEPLKVKRRSERPIVDGKSVIQELGYIETQVYRYFWITTEELQNEVALLEDMAQDGWVLVGDPTRTAIFDALDLYNAQATMHRFVSE